MIIRLAVFVGLLFSFSVSMGQETEMVKLTVQCVNEEDGETIKDGYTILVLERGTNKEVVLKKNKNQKFYPLARGKEVIIKVQSASFLSEEKMIETETIEEFASVTIRLKPNNVGTYNMRIVDSRTLLPINGTVLLERKNVKNVSVSDINQIFYEIPEDGAYTVSISAEGYKKQSFSIDLKKSGGYREQTVSMDAEKIKMELAILDSLNKGTIKNAKVKVKIIGINTPIFDGVSSNGIVEIEAFKGDEMEVYISAEDYTPVLNAYVVKAGIIPVHLLKGSVLQLNVKDERNLNALEGELILVNPLGVQTKLKSSKFSPITYNSNLIGSYSIETNVGGYRNVIKNVSIKELNFGVQKVDILLSKGSNEFQILAYDLSNKAPLDSVQIKVLDQNKKEIVGFLTKNRFVSNLYVDLKYKAVLSCKGFETQEIDILDQNIISVYLKRTEIDSLRNFTIKLMDGLHKTVLNTGKITILNAINHTFEPKFDSIKAEFVVKSMDPKLSYDVELSSSGYEGRRVSLNLKDKGNVFELKPNNIQNIKFLTFDEISNVRIYPKVNVQMGDLLMPYDSLLGINLAPINSYNISLDAAGYPDHVFKDSRFNSPTGIVTTKLQKTWYPVSFILSPQLTDSQWESIIFDIHTIETNEQMKFVSKINENRIIGEINPKMRYFIKISLKGMKEFSTEFDIKKIDIKDFSYKISLIPIANDTLKSSNVLSESKSISKENISQTTIVSGKSFKLEGVEFVKSTTKMTEESSNNLKGILEYLKSHPKAKIEITGHSDNSGDDQRLNKSLSEFRAKVVGNYLFNNGIASNRIQTKGMGSSMPLVDNLTEENRQKNRRIEALILEL